MRRLVVSCLVLIATVIAIPSKLRADDALSKPDARARATRRSVLSSDEWTQVEQAVNKALEWLSKQQEPDGSLPTRPQGNPAITSLGVLAYLSAGHLPGEGQYGDTINRAVDFVLQCQQPSGLLSCGMSDPNQHFTNFINSYNHTAHYNHGIAALMLSEVYGMTDADRAERVRESVESAIEYALASQNRNRGAPKERGGWRYYKEFPHAASDLSITGWQLLFLRSARNAGFDVPSEPIDQAMGFVKRCFDYRGEKTFMYGLRSGDVRPSRAMAGHGILALAMGGLHHTTEAQQAGDWILHYSVTRYNHYADKYADDPRWKHVAHIDRYHYATFLCTKGMYQLGGRYWEEFFPPTVRQVLANQAEAGHWDAELLEDEKYGNAYTTALMVLTLTTPDQLLPIYQR